MVWRHIYRTDDFGDAEADADEGVEAGHDGGEDGEPRHLVEVGYLRQQHLREAEEQHVIAVPSHRARRVVAFPVVAIGLPDRPADREKDGTDQDMVIEVSTMRCLKSAENAGILHQCKAGGANNFEQKRLVSLAG